MAQFFESNILLEGEECQILTIYFCSMTSDLLAERFSRYLTKKRLKYRLMFKLCCGDSTKTYDSLFIRCRFVSGTISARMALFPATGRSPLECETYAMYELSQVIRSKISEYKALKSMNETSNLILLVRRGDDNCQVSCVLNQRMDIISFDLRVLRASSSFQEYQELLLFRSPAFKKCSLIVNF